MHLGVIQPLIVSSTNPPLVLPDEFDASMSLMRRPGTDLHPLFLSASLVEELLINGAPEDLECAARILEAILERQERTPGAKNYGNFLWNAEDPAIRDTNAVEFILRILIVALIRFPERIPAPLRERTLDAIRAGLIESRRKDVAVTYTNIAVLDCTNSCLGGELLGDAETAQRGYEKLKRVAAVTASNGTVYEYLTPHYNRVIMDGLGRLIHHVQHEETRIRARTMAARYTLSMALHIHPVLHRLAGPYSRAYYPEVIAESAPDESTIRHWIAIGIAPRWIERILERRMTLPMQIEEAAFRKWDITTTSWLDEDFSLGVASREISRQTNGFVVHYPVDDSSKPGVVISRYLINDTFFEDGDREIAQGSLQTLNDEGKFWGVQWGPRAIMLMAPRNLVHQHSPAPASRDAWHSAKAVVAWTRRDTVDGIWIGGQRIEQLPAEVPDNTVVVVACGPIYVGIRPLRRTNLGKGAPARLIESRDYLAIEMYNYLGGAKIHNDLERMSRFYQGQPQCGFYAEIAPRDRFADGAEFAKTISSGTLRDEAAPPFTVYAESAERLWEVEYSRAGAHLGLEIDLIDWKLKRRWTEHGELSMPMLESPVARQNESGRIEVEGVALICSRAPAWLYADAASDFYVAGYHGAPGPLTLELPGRRVHIDGMGEGTIVYDAGRVTVDALGRPELIA